MRIAVAPLPGSPSILLDTFALERTEVPCLLFELCGMAQCHSEAMGFAAETALFGLMTPTESSFSVGVFLLRRGVYGRPRETRNHLHW